MAILSENDWIASYKQQLRICKASRSGLSPAKSWYSTFDGVGQPSASSLAVSSLTTGIVPVASDVGYPSIETFPSGATGYLTSLSFGMATAGRFRLFDRLFVCGSYDYNASATLSSQPSYASRLPFKVDGTTRNYSGTEIWLEASATITGNISVTVTYTNQDGVTGRTATTPAASSANLARCWQLALQAGDTGVQKIESVSATGASAGTACFNIMVLRRLADGYVEYANGADNQDLFRVGLIEIPQNAALYLAVGPDGTTPGVIEVSIGIASK